MPHGRFCPGPHWVFMPSPLRRNRQKRCPDGPCSFKARVAAMPGWTAADLPSLAGRTAIVTGASGGLGEVTARELARVGAYVILAVRNTEKGEATAQQMIGDVEVRRLDLQDLSSVRQFADGVDTVDVLINNAGIMAT